MGLEILFNKTDNLHENVQFDRVALHLVPFFEEQGWDGLLIGNPVSEDYPRFRADAVLLYTNGLIIIDFKDYRGEIILPLNDDNFKTENWYNNTLTGDRIKIQAGNSHNNPFKQLNKYRGVMKGIIRDDGLMKYVIDENRVCALNIFSGPITMNRETSREVPYYQLKSELDLHTFLNQYASENKYEKPIAAKFKALFPAQEWKGDLSIDPNTYYAKLEIMHQPIDENIEPALKEFYSNNNSGILVLESMDQGLRDEWMKMVNTYALENGSPETDIWCHSSRIARKIKLRTNFDVFSLYTIIYGGNGNTTKKVDDDTINDENTTDESELSQEVIGLKSDSDIDENATIIIPEAHLVSRSLHQSDLMRFGTGRLLEDFIKFLSLDKTNRKVIFIGDPYMLSYGKVEDCALNIDTLNDVFPDGNILNYRYTPEKRANDTSLLQTRKAIGSSINQKYYNRLNYEFDASLLLAEHNDGLNCIREWFSSPLENEPKQSVLFFSKKDARTTNLWIKNNLLNNGKELAENDVLILNNNINIADETGLGIPTKAVNGSYFLVREVMDQIPETITNRKNEVVATLLFRRLKVQLLGSILKADTEIILLENYLDGIEELSREEQVAFKIFINIKLAAAKKQYPFESSHEHKNLQFDKDYKDINSKIEKWYRLRKEDEDAGTKRNLKAPKTDLEKYKSDSNKVKKRYVSEYSNNLLRSLRNSDPFINAALVNYGWAITVHKSVGSSFDSVLLKATQQEEGGRSNESYFRWLYSGLTVARSKLYILSPQTISPFDNCKVVDEVGINNNTRFTPVRSNLSFENVDVSNVLKRFNIVGYNYNSLIVIQSLLKKLDGYSIININKSTDYLIKASLVSKENIETVIAVSNNGNKEVSSIRIERTGEESQQHIENAIEQLFHESKKGNFPTDFRKDIYKDWINKLKEQDCLLYLQESHQNEDRFSVTRANEVVNFIVRYTTGERNYGFFSNLTIKEKNNKDLAEIIKSLIDND